MTNIVETNFGTLINPSRVANGSASSIVKKGAFYVFSLRLSSDDIREYSFTNRDRAVAMRKVLLSHMESKLYEQMKKRA